MIRMILRQIWNERRANALVFLELLVVSVCLFYTADYLYIKYKEYKRPLGFDIGHVYNVELGVVPEGSPDFDTTAVHTSGRGKPGFRYDRCPYEWCGGGFPDDYRAPVDRSEGRVGLLYPQPFSLQVLESVRLVSWYRYAASRFRPVCRPQLFPGL